MKKKLKLLAFATGTVVAAMASLNGSTSIFSNVYGQSGSQTWKAEQVDCYDGTGKIVGTAVGCFNGLLPFCTPQNCPPPKPPTPPNPPH
ncbi:hypothetical protein [Sphingobacterium allocomposti]|uniref:hypothetical protein n=1 Tax=Sphingobacterium allocomposti TaxID=415956 RepID=UPI0011E6504C|nr:hypothetical protein [Sphingobacterium composti Yoo et al. 2007 non Ten et al. 2007]